MPCALCVNDCGNGRPDLLEGYGTYVAYPRANTASRHRANMLTLCCRDISEPVMLIRLNDDFCATVAEGGGQWDDLDDIGAATKNALCGYHHRRSSQPRFGACRSTKI